MADDLVTLDRDDAIAVVSLNRPERLNAYGREMGAALLERMEAVAADPEVRAVVLRGNGRAFCAGLDYTSDIRRQLVWFKPASAASHPGDDAPAMPGNQGGADSGQVLRQAPD